MAEVTEQRAIGLTHLLARLLAKRVVGLGDVDGDQPLVVTREDVLGGGAALEREGQATLLPGCTPIDRQTKAKQAVQEPALGGLEACPRLLRIGGIERGDHLVERAGQTEWTVALNRDRPVADIVLHVVGAQSVTAVLRFAGERNELRAFSRRIVTLIG